MFTVNNNVILEFSMKVTLSAIENGLIPTYVTPEEQAEAIASFFKTFAKSALETKKQE